MGMGRGRGRQVIGITRGVDGDIGGLLEVCSLGLVWLVLLVPGWEWGIRAGGGMGTDHEVPGYGS